ncbi:glycosyltransferase [Dictyobacter alpinus]|nr:glycosyltransferase [Dictyobacter alpinus]
MASIQEKSATDKVQGISSLPADWFESSTSMNNTAAFTQTVADNVEQSSVAEVPQQDLPVNPLPELPVRSKIKDDNASSSPKYSSAPQFRASSLQRRPVYKQQITELPTQVITSVADTHATSDTSTSYVEPIKNDEDQAEKKKEQITELPTQHTSSVDNSRTALSFPDQLTSSMFAIDDDEEDTSFGARTTSTIEMLASFPTRAFKKLATQSIPALMGSSRLDKFATVPASAVQGLASGNKKVSNVRLRLTGIIFILVAAFYFPWLLQVLNKNALWLSIPFFLSMCYLTVIVVLSIYNNWTRIVYPLIQMPQKQEPKVAVCIPTYGETPDMVQTTIESVLSQDWPQHKLLIIVGDDSHRPAMKEMVQTIQHNYPMTQVVYHEPPRKGNPERKGSAKDGNLNSMLAYIIQNHPEIAFIETRDADDVIGSPQFLRYTIGHLHRNKDVAYVQTIKDTLVSKGDPFGNRQSFFYRGVMLSRNAANAVFPCGSGLVWRRKKLEEIGGFPTWNLVEDLYSGYVAMQHGFKNAYLPVVGAVGQTSPEDIPNVYKQLGTWALDTVRIFLWKNPWFVKGLSFKQRMQFTELGLFYLFSIPLCIFLFTPVISLFTGIYPFTTNNLDYMLHFWLYAASIELLLTIINGSTTFEENWRARQMWFGMIFVFMKSCFLALTYGPNKKPAYKVTRKTQEAGIYLREVFVQTLLFLLLLSACVYNVFIHRNYFLRDTDLGSIFWAVLFMGLLLGIIHRSWFGYQIKKKPARS